MKEQIITQQQESAFNEYNRQIKEIDCIHDFWELTNIRNFWEWYACYCEEHSLFNDRAS